MLFLKRLNLSHHHHHNLLKPYNYSALISLLSNYPHTFTTLSNPTTIKHSSSSSSSHFMVVDYLISTLGFPPDQAIKVSKPIAHLKSPSKPNSVIHFLHQNGWTQSQIRSLIAKRPNLLCCNVDKTLQPKLTAMQAVGLSDSQLIQFICDNPHTLSVADIQPKIKFFQQLLGGNDELLRANKDSSLLCSSLDKKIIPNISLLRECGITDRQIVKIIKQNRGMITKSMASLVAVVERAERLGVPRGCGMFYWTLHVVSTISVATLDVKLQLLRSLGWSEAEIACAIRKTPMLLGYSEKKIRSTMRFLMEEVGWTLSDIAFRPGVLGFSLHKRLIPRHSVLKNLKELPKGPLELYNYVFMLNEKQFLERYVLPHKEKLPGLYEAYISAAAGKASI